MNPRKKYLTDKKRHAEMTYKMKFISKKELDAIKERFKGEEK